MILPREILPRQTNYNNNNNCYYDTFGRLRCYNTNWNSWGRWVTLAAIVVGFFILFFLLSCISARRRRRRGHSPYYGTGWMAGRTPQGHGQATYTGGNAQPYYANNSQYGGNYQQPAPPYSPPGQNGYYGNQQSGIELQQPQNSYQPNGNYARGGEHAYQPPPGPPPGKEHVVR